MPEKDQEAGQLDKAEIILGMILIANDESAKIKQPGEQSLNLPTALEATQCTTVLGDAIHPTTGAVWSNHLGTKLLQHFLVQRVTVVALVANEALRHIGDKSLLQGLTDQFHFSRASTFCAYGDRKTIAVCNCHDLGALATL